MSQVLNISHVDRLNKNANDYYLLVGEGDTGLPSWYIIKSTARQMSAAQNNNAEPVDLATLGIIIESGFGLNPTSSILKKYQS